MVADPRISDKELAAINAAAVTREYRVQPHLDYRTVSAINGNIGGPRQPLTLSKYASSLHTTRSCN
ncbi:hypothetical protein EIP86_008602 [Pleurotus ostreatoroseus]|nr:hypothetical protein EIP86_008602 [Pleurotus ostreatoroseus]